MSDATPDPLPRAAINVEDLNAMVAAVVELKARAETATAAAEEANRKANSESGFAYNAKQNAEDHAKAIAQVRGTVDADSNWLTTTKANATTAAEAIESARKTAENDARIALETRVTIEQVAATIKATQERIDAAFTAADKAREDALGGAKRIAEDVAAVIQARANGEAAGTAVQALQAQLADAAAKAQVEATAISARSTESSGLLTAMTKVSETAKAAQTRVDEYEHNLKALTSGMEELSAKIESLLPGATSAGLASAFRDQKARFNRPQRIWFWTFVVSIVALFVVGMFGVIERLRDPATVQLTWDLVRLRVVNRLPIAVPVIWLALYAGRHYTLALRLQEDYAYKEAISTAFEGYRREMASMPLQPDQLVPVLALCDNVLKTLGQRPGRLYDGKHEDVTPLTPLRSFLRELGSKKAVKEPEV